MRKLLSTTIAAGILATASIAPAFANIAAGALPVEGSSNLANVTTSGNNMNVQINAGVGGVGSVNWNSFNVGKDASVNFEFTNHNQTALNKVDAAGGLSQIYGSITSSGCAGCGYDATGKVILINPNGVLFGAGANVNLNSFTVSTMDGTFDDVKNQLNLDRTGASQYGIIVQDGAKIHADKGVTFASDNVALYSGSKITTNVGNNVGDAAFGKIKIVTSDGVNFTYYNNGAVKEVSDIKNASDKMTVSVNGQLASGNIDIRNYSSNVDSQINLNGAVLKATKALKGNDGNIWLTASNKVVVDNTYLTTVSAADAADARGGNVKILAGEKASVKSAAINAVGDISVTSNNADAIIDSSIVNAAKNVNLTANNIASIQTGSKVSAENINVKASKNAWLSNANLDADLITIEAENNIVSKNLDLNNNKAVITAGNDIELNVKNVGERQNGLVAKAGNDMTVSTDGTLSVSSLISGNDMTLNASEIISGYGKTNNYLREDGDSSDRAYIEVGGTFTSNPDYTVTDSADLTDDGLFNKKHHIQYGDGSEKILLVNKKPVTTAPVDPVDPVDPVNPVDPVDPVDPDTDDTDTVSLDVDEEQAQMLNRIPRVPETYNNAADIQDTRTTFVDVFAAASQIEIVEDEEE